MASRIVDGEGVWRSQKLKKVDEKYRSEYANLIPLAEANGCFECDTHLIWAIVYAFNRPTVTMDDVEEMLSQFENADMLERYEFDGKVFGRWIGIEKPGRLPSAVHQQRYANLPPTPQQLPVNPEGNRPLDGIIDDKCLEHLGVVEERKFYNKDLKAAVRKHGYDAVLSCFSSWVEFATASKKPVSTFLRGLDTMLASGSTGTATNPVLQRVEDHIALRSDNRVFFHTQQKAILATLIKEFGEDAVIKAFDEFMATWSEDSFQYAGKNFIEQAPTRIRTIKAKQQREEEAKKSLRISQEQAEQQAQAQLKLEAEPEDDL